MPLRNILTQALSPNHWRFQSTPSTSSGNLAQPNPSHNNHISSSLRRPTPAMPMREPRNTTERVPEINAVLNQLMRDEVVPQIGRQLADKWQTLGAELQTPTMPGSISTPQMKVNVPQVLNKLATGTLKIVLPLKPGPINLAGFRQVVKSDSYLEVALQVKDGFVDTQASSLSVWRSKETGNCNPKPNPHRSKLCGPAAPLPGVRHLGGFKGLNFDELGNLKLNLVGLSWNLNKYLGLTSDSPLAAGDLISKLLEKAELSPDLEIANEQTYAMAPVVGRMRAGSGAALLDGLPRGRTDTLDSFLSAKDLGKPAETLPQDETANADSGPDWLDWENMHINFTGQFMPGELPLGEHSVLSLAPGTEVTIKDANPTTLALSFDAALNGGQLSAQGSQWVCGAGRAQFDLNLESPLPLGAPDCVSLRFTDFDLKNVSLQVPANIEDDFGGPLYHQVHLAELKLKPGQQDGHQALGSASGLPLGSPSYVVYDNRIARETDANSDVSRDNASDNQSSNASGDANDVVKDNASLSVNVPDLRLARTSAVLHTMGAGQGSGRLQMGLGDGNWAKEPMTILAGLSFESSPSKSHFEVKGQVESGRVDLVSNGHGRQARMGLVSSQYLSLAARAVRLRGTGGFGFQQADGKAPHLYLSSNVHEKPWQVVIEDYDAQLLDPNQGLLVDVYDRGSDREMGVSAIDQKQDLPVNPMPDRRNANGISGSAIPRSQLAVRSLAFGGPESQMPCFDASGVLAVTLGGLQYRGAQSDHNLNLQGGSHGELIIKQAFWPADAPSPQVEAHLSLTAGGDVKFTASEIKTLEGADIGVRVGDKGAQLHLDFKADESGHVVCDTDLSLREGQVRTRVKQMTDEVFASLQARLAADEEHPIRLLPPVPPSPESLPLRAGFELQAQSALEPIPLAQVAPSLRLDSVDDLVLSLVPRLKLNTEFLPILKAVREAEVMAEMPLAVLRENLPDAISVRDDARAVLRFSVKHGKVDEGKIVFQPNLDIHWGVVTFKLKEIALAPSGDTGALAVRPSAGIRFLGVPTYVPTSVQMWAAGKCLQSFLGRSDLPGELSPLVSVLANSSEQLKHQLSAHVAVEPRVSASRGAKVAIQAGLGPYAAPEPKSPAAASVPVLSNVAVAKTDALSEISPLVAKGATVTIKAKEVAPFELDLGDGQKLSCGPKSHVSLVLQDEQLQVSGHLDLSGDHDATSITTPGGYAFAFAEGAVDVDATFSVGKSQPTHCELSNVHLKNLRMTAKPIGLKQTLEVPEIKQGKIILDEQNGSPRLICALNPDAGGAPFKLKWDGVSAVGDQKFGANDLSVEGGLEKIVCDAKGVSLTAPKVTLEADEMILPLAEGQHVMATLPRLSAKAQINLDVNGGVQCDLVDCATSPVTRKNMMVSLYEGQMARDTFRFGPLTADKITLAFGSGVSEPGLAGQGLRCEQMAIEKRLDLFQDNPEEGSALGLGNIRVEQGAVELSDFYVGDTNYRFIGQVHSGSVKLHDFTLAGGGLALQAPQLACAGDMKFKILPDQLALMPLGDMPLSIKSELSDVSLVTRSPEMTLQLKGERQLPSGQRIGPTLDAKLIGLNISQGDAVSGYAQIADAVVRGRLDRGDIVVGPDASALNRVQLHSGEADVEIQTLRLELPEDGELDPELLLRARLRLASEVRDVRQPGQEQAAVDASDASAQETLPIKLFVERMSLNGQLNLTMDALLQTGSNDLFNAWIESAARVDQGQAKVDIRGQIDDLRQADARVEPELKPLPGH